MAVITENELKQQIKSRAFSPVYVIHGSEQMLVKGYTKKLVEAVTDKAPSDFNYHVFSGDVNIDELAAAVQVVPFMSEYNCVVLTDVFLDEMKSEDVNALKDIVKNTADGTVFIISMPSYVPKKNEAAFKSIVKSVQKLGSVIDFEKLNQNSLEKYIAKWSKKCGKLMPRVCADQLINYCGDDLNLLKNETEKICAYASADEVTLDDIEKLATVNLESKIFALSEAVINGNGKEAFVILDRLFYQKEEPIVILYTISNSYIDAYRMRVAAECGVIKNIVAADFEYKNRAFTLGKAQRATARVSTEALRESLTVLIEADLKIKSQTVNERLFLEQLIARLLLIAREGRVYA